MKTITLQLEDNLVFTIAGETHEVPVDSLTEAALVGLLQYGKRKANDTFNGMKGGEKALTALEVIAKIQTWDFGTGGSKVSPLIRILRGIVGTHLVSLGHKKKDAMSMAKEPKEGFKSYLHQAMAKKQGVGMVEVEEAAIESAFEVNWPKVEARAQNMLEEEKRLEAQRTDMSFDL